MQITKEYDVERGIVVLTVENPPLPTTKHTIIASALVDGTVNLQDEIDRLTEDAVEQRAVYDAVKDMIDG